jgi:DNA-binding GntR family transcriptional regulator
MSDVQDNWADEQMQAIGDDEAAWELRRKADVLTDEFVMQIIEAARLNKLDDCKETITSLLNRYRGRAILQLKISVIQERDDLKNKNSKLNKELLDALEVIETYEAAMRSAAECADGIKKMLRHTLKANPIKKTRRKRADSGQLYRLWECPVGRESP